MKRKYWYIIIIIVILAGLAAWFFLIKKSEIKIQWRSAQADHGDIRILVTATGTLNADTTVQVGTQVSGIISKIFVDFNSVVKKGDVVALLDTTYLAAAVEDAASSLYRAQVQVDLTKRTYDRTKIMLDEKVVAQADYDQALSDYETAKGSLRSAKSALDRAKINLKYATIVAPVSGVVISRAVDRGQTVAASFNTPTLFTIANDLTKMQVQANVDEADIGKIQVGQEVTFTVDAYTDRTFSGTVRQIRLQPTVTQNVVDYTVIIDVPNPDMRLMPGMTANITVKIQELQNVLRVPSTALRFWPPQEYLDKAMKDLPDSTKKLIQDVIKFRQKRNQRGQGKQMSGGDAAMAMNSGSGNPSQNASASGNQGGTTKNGSTAGNGQQRGNTQAGNHSGWQGSHTGEGRSGMTGGDHNFRHGDSSFRKGNHNRDGNNGGKYNLLAKGNAGGSENSEAQGMPSGKQLQVGQGQAEPIRMRMGIIWVMEGEKLVPRKVRAGLTDGSFTMIEGKLKDGEQVITGVVNGSLQSTTSQQQQSPFMPQMGRPAAGRGGR